MAIAGMNGQWLGGRAIRTNWANGKSNANSGREPQHNGALVVLQCLQISQ